MLSRTLRSLPALVVSLALGLSLSSCSDATNKDEEATEALPPVIVELDQLDGETFEITSDRPLVVNAPEPADWQGETADPAVAVFAPGRLEESAEYNPGFEAVGPGLTSASMTGPDGTTYNFELAVP